jgi:hypothetical protein
VSTHVVRIKGYPKDTSIELDITISNDRGATGWMTYLGPSGGRRVTHAMDATACRELASALMYLADAVERKSRP